MPLIIHIFTKMTGWYLSSNDSRLYYILRRTHEKVTDLPDKNKRPKNKPRKQIKVNSFATAMLAKAEQDKYKGPQAVDENGHTKEDPKEKYENECCYGILECSLSKLILR